jgi:hypothetical protein
MNVSIIHKPDIGNSVLDGLAGELPDIIAKTLEVPGGNLARLKPEQVALSFSPASPRDTGADIRIMAFAKNNIVRKTTENARAQQILEKVVEAIRTSGGNCSVDVRLYFMEIGTAEHSAGA